VELRELNVKLHELYSRCEEAYQEGDLEEALERGIEILDELLNFARSNVVGALTNPSIREVANRVLIEYERGLAYVKGAQEVARSTSPLYTAELLEKALSVLSACINGLFNFTVGALIVMAELASWSSP